VDDLWQARVSSDLVDVSHQGFNLGAAVSCTHSKFDALLVQFLEKPLQRERLHFPAVLDLNRKEA
jgi:hypothetical protein